MWSMNLLRAKRGALRGTAGPDVKVRDIGVADLGVQNWLRKKEGLLAESLS